MIEIRHDRLCFRFPQVHPAAICEVDFQRTLRIPDDNRAHHLPAGLGRFPLRHVDDHAARLPAAWQQHGGVLLPMYQAEALWLNFESDHGYPFAVKIAAGKVNAITGASWSNGLAAAPQDYLVLPDQPWLDGFCVGQGLIRQFVAMPLGKGYSAEEQLTGAALHGGLQIIAYPMRREAYDRLLTTARQFACESVGALSESLAMGLAPGGLMRQQVFADEHGIAAWDQEAGRRCFVHILNSRQWQAATGEARPHPPPDQQDYARAGLPWFDYYREDVPALPGAAPLRTLDSVAALAVKKGEAPPPDATGTGPETVVTPGPGRRGVKDGCW